MTLRATALVLALVPAASSSAAEPVPCGAAPDPGRQQEAILSYVKGRDLLQAGRWAEAEGPLLEAVRLGGASPFALYGLGQAAMELGRYADAASRFAACRAAFSCVLSPEQLAQARKRVDEDTRALSEALRELERSGQARASVKWLAANREHVPDGGERALMKSQLEGRMAELQGWKQSLGKRASPPQVTVALGTALFRAGALTEAEQEYEAVLAADPSQGDAHYDLAVVYLATDRVREAERELKLAVKAGLTVAPPLQAMLDRRLAALPKQ